MLREALLLGFFGALGYGAVGLFMFGGQLSAGMALGSVLFGVVFGPGMAFAFRVLFGAREKME